MCVRRCPTLPQGPPCSTIGAASLSFRVRNVSGRFPRAMAAETLATPVVHCVRVGCVVSVTPTSGRGARIELCVCSSVQNHRVDASNLVPPTPAFETVLGVVIIKLSAY